MFLLSLRISVGCFTFVLLFRLVVVVPCLPHLMTDQGRLLSSLVNTGHRSLEDVRMETTWGTASGSNLVNFSSWYHSLWITTSTSVGSCRKESYVSDELMTFRVPEVISDHTGTLDACSVPMIRAELQLEVFSASILLLLWICFRLWRAMMECLETDLLC